MNGAHFKKSNGLCAKPFDARAVRGELVEACPELVEGGERELMKFAP
jgi:hypothetical protein